MSVQLVAFGTKRWSSTLRGMAAATAHGRLFFEMEMIPDIERIEDAMFRAQGRRGGGSWRALSPETIATKARKAQDPRINIATGMLRESLVNRHAAGAVRIATNQRLVFGSTAAGARQSQRRRPVVRFTKFDRRRWARWWGQYIVRRGGIV